jgi:hypothetical protein
MAPRLSGAPLPPPVDRGHPKGYKSNSHSSTNAMLSRDYSNVKGLEGNVGKEMGDCRLGLSMIE